MTVPIDVIRALDRDGLSARSHRFLEKQMARHGRVNLEQLIFQAGQLNRARDGLSTNQYIQVATGEQRRLALLGQSWFNRMDQSAQMAPTDGAK